MENMSFTAQFKLFSRIPLIHTKANLKHNLEHNQNKTVDLNPFPAKEIIPKPLSPKHNYQEIENLHQVSNIIAILICFG